MDDMHIHSKNKQKKNIKLDYNIGYWEAVAIQ